MNRIRAALVIMSIASVWSLGQTADSAHEAPPESLVAEGASAVPEDTAAAVDSAAPAGTPPSLADPAAAAMPSVETTADSAVLDSTAKADLRDSLLAAQHRFREGYLRFPDGIDSVVGPHSIHPYQLFGLDACGISATSRLSPYGVPVPFSLSSSLNRFLHQGYPLTPSLLLDPGTLPVVAAEGTDDRFLTAIANITTTPYDGLTIDYLPGALVSPATFIFWENGVFGEAVLRVLFARPLSQNMRIGVFSNYRSFTGKEYSHRRGNIYPQYVSLYESAGWDTALVAHKGRNPLTREHVVGARTVWDGKEGERAELTYRYLDMKNDLALGDLHSLRWDTLSRFRHQLRAGASGIGVGPLHLSAEGQLQSHVQRRKRVLDHTGLDLLNSRAHVLALDGRLGVSRILYGGDTLQLTCRPQWQKRKDYYGSEWTIGRQRLTGEYVREWERGPLRGSIEAMGGHDFVTLNDSSGHVWVYGAAVRTNVLSHQLTLYGRRDAIAYVPSLDTLAPPGRLLDVHYALGAELDLSAPKAGLLVGYSFTNGVDSSSVALSWPYGIPPYRMPRSVISFAPRVGRFLGLALHSRILVSDKRPYLKARGGISYDVRGVNDDHHIQLDLGVNFWSERNPVVYGGESLWNEEILDVYLKTAVQIKTFRLFWKIDNLLNRKVAYVPGHWMPGLVFRWGFNWMLQR